MSSQAEAIMNAARAGTQKIEAEQKMSDGSPVTGTGAIYDDSQTVGQPGAASASNLKLLINSGHVKYDNKYNRLSHRGTTIFNRRREDIEVEAIMGEKRYVHNPAPASQEEIVKKNTALEADVKSLKSQVDIIVKSIGGDVKPVPLDVDYENLKWPELRKLAVSLDIPNRNKMKRAEIIEALNARKAATNV